MTREKKYKKEMESNELIPFGRARVKKIKMNGYTFQMETLEGDAKVIFIDFTGYININSEKYQDYTADVRRVRSTIKHKSYQLCSTIFPDMIPDVFIFDFDTTETSSHKIFRNSNHFDVSICIRFPYQIDVKEKGNDNLETFASELLYFMSKRYILSPISPKKVRELKELNINTEIDSHSDNLEPNEFEHQKEILEL